MISPTEAHIECEDEDEQLSIIDNQILRNTVNDLEDEIKDEDINQSGPSERKKTNRCG